MMRLLLFSLLLILSQPVTASEGFFFDIGLGFNTESGTDADRDFEGGRDIAWLGTGYYFKKPYNFFDLFDLQDVEIGYLHLSHYFRGWPGDKWFGWSGHEEEVNMLYVKKRWWW
ncbi:MAG: hypothetical protein JAY88_14715 [Candidatus Thiodiazotropha lotti]|nr:hypothetical protein [Candidatus Thiodiazotropha lotti]MCW4188316.1 hypothetical protein [Candidatus Thiodiazotropha lotti]